MVRFRQSLTFKLIIAFVLISLVEAAFIAIVVGGLTVLEFGRFQDNENHHRISNRLEEYYDRNDESWDNIEAWYMEELFLEPSGNPDNPLESNYILIDEDERVIFSDGEFLVGEQVDLDNWDETIRLRDRGETIGWILVEPVINLSDREYNAIETVFLFRVRAAIFVTTIVAVVLSGLAAFFFARGFTRPLQELTVATQDMAQGNLEQEVTVRSKDEIGRLSAAFNKMSHDLAQATQQRRQMTADIAHDLRTPLSIILGYTEAMSDGKLPGTPEIFSAIHGEANMLKRLIDDLRILAMADAGELPLNRMPLPPRELLERALLGHAGQAETAGIQLELDLAEGLPLVNVDAERMAQVFGNLVSNALRYTPDGGVIGLSAELTAGDLVRFKVRDTGSGIPAEDLVHIFDRFYRADKSREQSEGNSGLGLAIARSIVSAHGGEITAESMVGVGTTFTIDLPVNRA